MIRINLIPQEILDAARKKRLTIQGSTAAAVLVALLALISFAQYLSLRGVQAQAAQNTERLKKLQVLVSEVEDLQKTENGIQDRLNIMNGLLKNRPLYPEFMSDFARSAPERIQVQSLTTDGGGASAALKLTLSASARSNEDIAQWIKNMEDSGRFAAVTLGPVAAIGSGQDRAFSFTLDASYTPNL